MKLLLKAALRVRRHLSLFIVTLVALIGLTVASYVEMFSIGVISDTGADFFALFSSKNDKGKYSDYVTQEDIQEKWKKIDREKTGHITKDDAQSFMIKKTGSNPLKRVMYQIKRHFHFEQNMKAFITLLLMVAIFKALFLFFSQPLSLARAKGCYAC